MRDRMIILDDTRVRLSNIKNYGISSGKKFRQKLYTRKEVLNPVGVVASFFSLLEGGYCSDETVEYEYEWTGKWNEGMSKEEIDELGGGTLVLLDKGEIGVTRKVLASDSCIQEYQEKYLYITTFQNDNFVFWESEVSFDINEKCKEIDEMFNGD